MEDLDPLTGPTLRTECLARPKKLPEEYYLYKQLRSVYYIDYQPLEPNCGRFTDFITNSRLKQLSVARPIHKDFNRDRNSPIWCTPACCHKPSKRLVELSEPRPLSDQYIFDRKCVQRVSNAHKNVTASERICALAQSNQRKVWPSWDTYKLPTMYKPITPVSMAAISGPERYASYLEKLSQPIALPKAYQPPRRCPFGVAKHALKATMTPRLLEISLPISPIVLDKSIPTKSNYRGSTVTKAAKHTI